LCEEIKELGTLGVPSSNRGELR